MSTHQSHSTHAAAVSRFLRRQDFHRYQFSNETRGGFRATEWGQDVRGGTRVRIDYEGLGREIKQRSSVRYNRVLRERLFAMMKTLRDESNYEVCWGFDETTGEEDTTFIVVSSNPARQTVEMVPADPETEATDPYSDARQLMGWVANYLTKEGYIEHGSDAVAPYFGFKVEGSVNGGPVSATVTYRPGDMEDLAAQVHTVRRYADVLLGNGLSAVVRDEDTSPTVYVTEDAGTMVEVLERLNAYERDMREQTDQADRWEQTEEAMAEEVAAGHRLRGLLISLPQVVIAVQQVHDLLGQGRPEEARSLENQTYRSVLLAIVGGVDSGEDLAAAALETQHLSFPR